MEKKDKHEIYKLAKKMILSDDYHYLLCDILLDAAKDLDLAGDVWQSYTQTPYFLPEFASFKPKVNYIDPKTGEETKHWFDPNDLTSRVEILDKCIEMTKDN